MADQVFDQWAIVELFGHQRIAGHVNEQVVAGTGFVRVDVPAAPDREAFTRIFGTGAIYSIIPVSEKIATIFAARNVEAPILPYLLALPDHEEDTEEEETEDPELF